MSVTIEGLEAVLANMEVAIEQAIAESDVAIQIAGINAEASAKQRAPVDTGRFRAGYQYANTGLCQSEVSNAVEYGPDLEFGHHTRSGSFVPPQPSLFPAFVEAKVTLKDELSAIPGVEITSWS